MLRPILFFDVMGTLVHDPFFDEVPKFLGLPFRELLEVKHPTAWVEFERGEIEERDFLPRFFRDRRAYDHAGLKETMKHAYRWLEGAESMLAELATRGVTMHALSNYTPWYELIEEQLGLSRYLPWTFVSCRTGVRKPHAEAYLGAARSLGVSPQECLFIDDRDANCEGARRVRMPALLFREVPALRAELSARGVL